LPDVTEIPDLLVRRAAEQRRIRMMLDSMRAEEEAMIKGERTLLHGSRRNCA